MSVRELYAELGVDLPSHSAERVTVRCFANPSAHKHDDRNPSCEVKTANGHWRCHGCGEWGDVYKAAIELGSRPADALELVRRHGLAKGGENGSRPEIVAAYDYLDEAGELLFQVVRMAPKDFRQRKPDGRGGWTWKLGETRRVPYRLPQVRQRAEQGGRVFVVEGEKDVHALEQHGHVATCNPGGAGKWRPEYGKALRGAEVAVIADRDTAGRRHARQVLESLQGAKAYEPASGNDIADHLSAGLGLRDLRPLAESEPHDEATYTPERWADAILRSLERKDDAMAPLPFGPLNEELDGGLRAGEVCLVAGWTSQGKSVFVDQIADEAAAQGRRVHLYLTEMTAAQRGLRLLARRTGVGFRELRRKELSPADWQAVMRELNRLPYGVSIVTDWNVDRVVEHIREHRWDVVVVDLVHGFHYADERDLSKSSTALVRAAKGWQPGAVVVAAAHLNDGQMRDQRSVKRPRPGLHSIKGSSALKQDADVVLFVWLEDDDDGVPTNEGAIWLAKNRNGGFAGVPVQLNPRRMRFEDRSLDGVVGRAA